MLTVQIFVFVFFTVFDLYVVSQELISLYGHLKQTTAVWEGQPIRWKSAYRDRMNKDRAGIK